MKKTPILSAMVILLGAAAPVVGGEDRSERLAPSIHNEPTAAGSSRTDPGIDTDRISPAQDAPTGLNKPFRGLDENEDERLDESELRAYRNPAAGSDVDSEAERGERNLKFYDFDQDDSVSRDEWERGEAEE